jgi:hypothetical protein
MTAGIRRVVRACARASEPPCWPRPPLWHLDESGTPYASPAATLCTETAGMATNRQLPTTLTGRSSKTAMPDARNSNIFREHIARTVCAVKLMARIDQPAPPARARHNSKHRIGAHLAHGAAVRGVDLLTQLLERAPHHLAVAAKLLDARVDRREVRLVEFACAQFLWQLRRRPRPAIC